jgi:hypothetical protein
MWVSLLCFRERFLAGSAVHAGTYAVLSWFSGLARRRGLAGMPALP